jgi:hypothetical protein
LIAFSLVAGLLGGGPAVAHTFTKSDGNDVKGKLDIRSVTVSHTATGAVVYRFRTYNSWTARELGPRRSFFIIQISEDGPTDRNYDLCAFIFFASGKLRGSLTDCGQTRFRGLNVAKLSGTTAKLTIPKPALPSIYWWGSASVWFGPAPCADGCVDFAPNRYPDLLHDLLPPSISMTTSALRIWEGSNGTDTTFDFPFNVTDANVGMKSWKVESRLVGETTWHQEAAGTGGGSKNPTITELAGQYTYRVTAIDKQGNKATKSRPVFVPTDVTDPGGPGTFTGGATTIVAGAYGGDLVALNDTGDEYRLEYVDPGGPCRAFDVIGPGTGDWVVQVEAPDLSISGPLAATDFPDDQRQRLFKLASICGDFTITFTVTSGSGFAIDAVLI